MNGNNYALTTNVNGTKAAGTLKAVPQSAVAAASAFNSLGSSLKKIGQYSSALNHISEKLQMMRDKLAESIQPGVDLDTALMNLSAVTGLTGKGLEEVGMHARETAKTFGGSAAENAESYKLILSQLSPEMAKVPKALALMGAHIRTTSKAMGNDTRAAAEILTTAMNQFQVSLSDPMLAAKEMGSMMNIMAAAAKEGSAGLPAIKAALEQSGTAAKAAGVSFAETNAAIQVLAQAGKKGSEGGAALRNVMETLAQGRFLPEDVQEELKSAGVNVSLLTDKSQSLAARLKSLQGVMGDDALSVKLFGKENAGAALALLSGIPALESYTVAIQGTDTAARQAQTVMSGYAERMSRMQAQVDDLKISLFNFAGEIMPLVTGVVAFFQGTASVMAGINAIACFAESTWAKAIARRTKELWKGTVATVSAAGSMGIYNAMTLAAVATTYGFSFAIRAVGKAIYSIPIIGWIAAGITLLITAFKILWDKSEGFRRGLFAIWEVLKAVFHNIGVVVMSVWENFIKPYYMLWWSLVKTVATGIWSALKWCWDGIVAGFTPVGDFFVWLWDGVMSGAAALGEFFTGIWGWIRETCGDSVDWIVSVFNKIVGPVKAIFAPISDFVSGIFNKISEKLGKFIGWISNVWNKVFPKDQFKDLGEAAQAGATKGSESWQKSQEAKKKAGVPEETATPVFPEIAQNTSVRTAANTQKQTAASKGGTVDLANIKGSAGYAAIVAKMAPVKIGGLSAQQLPATVPQTPQGSVPGKAVPAKQEYEAGPKTDYITEIALNVRRIAAGIALLGSMQMAPVAALPAAAASKQIDGLATEPVNPLSVNSPQKRSGEQKGNINFGKFCETVVIQVPAGTTQEQAEFLYRDFMKKINDQAHDN